MTATQLLLLIGTIWIAPHAPKPYSIVVGLLFCIASVTGEVMRT